MIQHKLLNDKSSIHVFYEEAEYNEEHPELTNFGFDILTKWKFMPELLYILIKGGELKASDRNWYRYYHFDLENKCLTQIFREPRAKEDTVIKTFLRDDEIKDLCKLISEKQREYRGEIIAKSSERKEKIRDSQLKNYADKRQQEQPRPTPKDFVKKFGLDRFIDRTPYNPEPPFDITTDEDIVMMSKI